MLKDLAMAIEGLEVPVDRESLVEAIALRDQLDARIAAAVGELEGNGWWAVDASAPMTAWLRPHALMTRRSAQRLRSTAMRHDLPAGKVLPSPSTFQAAMPVTDAGRVTVVVATRNRCESLLRTLDRVATVSGDRILASAGRDAAVRRGIGDALAAMPEAVRRRQVIDPHLDGLLRMLELAPDGREMVPSSTALRSLIVVVVVEGRERMVS